MKKYDKCPTCGSDKGNDIHECGHCGHVGCNHQNCASSGNGRCANCQGLATKKKRIGQIK